MPGFADLVLMLIVALFVFGTPILPKIATAAGKALVRLRHGINTKEYREVEAEAAEEEREDREQQGE